MVQAMHGLRIPVILTKSRPPAEGPLRAEDSHQEEPGEGVAPKGTTGGGGQGRLHPGPRLGGESVRIPCGSEEGIEEGLHLHLSCGDRPLPSPSLPEIATRGEDREGEAAPIIDPC